MSPFDPIGVQRTQTTLPPPTDDIRLDDAQVRQAAREVLDVGSRPLWIDDHDERLQHSARIAAVLDDDSASRLFAEVLRQDPGAFGSWLRAGRLNDLVASGRIGAAERDALAGAIAGAYDDGGVHPQDALDFFGTLPTPRARVPVDSEGNPVHPADGPQQDFGGSLQPFSDGQRQTDPVSGRTVIDVVQGTTGDWNNDLTIGRGEDRGWSDVFEPEAIYRTPEGYLFHTDADGRIERVQGSLQLDSGHDRSPSQQDIVVDRYGEKGEGVADPDQGGHWIARMFRGPGEGINLTPMRESINNGTWGRMEDDFRRHLEAGNHVEVDIQGIYPDAGGTPPPAHPDRPDGLVVEYWVSDPSGRLIEHDTITYDNRRP